MADQLDNELKNTIPAGAQLARIGFNESNHGSDENHP